MTTNNHDDYEGYQSFKSWAPDSFGHINMEQKIYFDREFELIQVGGLTNKVIVEIGFGNGSFWSWTNDQGNRYYGFELIPELVKTAQSRGVNAFDANSAVDEVVPAETVDYVIAWDVFEHLTNDEIHLKLTECHKVLKSGGKLIARVPSGDSPFSGPLQNGDQTHKTSIGSSMVIQFAKKANFYVDTIRSPVFPLTGLGFKTFSRRLLVIICRGVFYPFISKAFMGAGNPVLTQNMIFILQKP
jgi:2-polyprenyl-3-methyl-5-hydroxy-6-metoxy-1,4-benzoquinol methylase